MTVPVLTLFNKTASGVWESISMSFYIPTYETKPVSPSETGAAVEVHTIPKMEVYVQ